MWIETLQYAFGLLAIWARVAFGVAGSDGLQLCLQLAIPGLKFRYLSLELAILSIANRKLVAKQREMLSLDGCSAVLFDQSL
jgi:hypothetical protein